MTNLETQPVQQQIERAKALAQVIDTVSIESDSMTNPVFILEMLALSGFRLEPVSEYEETTQAYERLSGFHI